jgi:site-specific DNA-adenine methylase
MKPIDDNNDQNMLIDVVNRLYSQIKIIMDTNRMILKKTKELERQQKEDKDEIVGIINQRTRKEVKTDNMVETIEKM